MSLFSSLSPQLLFKTSSVLYALTAPGHVLVGYQAVYPALNKIPQTKFEDRMAARGSANCWNFLTTSLAVSALLHWQWARTAGPTTLEENVIFWITSLHTFANGLRYLQVGEVKAALALTVSSAVGIAAVLLQMREMK